MKILLTNSHGESVELSETSSYALFSVEGLGSTDTLLSTTKSAGQDGVNYQGNTIDSRSVSIEISIVATGKEDMNRKRSNLLKILNPKLEEMELTYLNGSKIKKLIVVPELVSFPPAEHFADSVQGAIIELYAPDPYFKNPTESKSEIALWRPSFGFPLSIPNEGIKMGFREPSLIVNVFNKGDVETGMRIKFKALGEVVNPSLFNVNTREYFKINKTMAAGEVIEVNTNFQNKRVNKIKQGVVTNVFHYIDLTSTFLQLDPGDNLLRYDADENIDNLEVDIYYNPRSLGV